MSIRKITEEEILTYGVKHLSSRPNTPSLYEGKPLSAEELKDAFDKLPRLIAERFNDLLAATGLFGEDASASYDSFAEVIETKLSPSHSLAKFFEDVKNGTLSSYLTLPDDQKLADAISSMKSEILSLQNTSTAMDAAKILKEAKAYADAPRGTVSSRSTLPVSGKAVYQAISKIGEIPGASPLADRVEALEKAASEALYTYPDTDRIMPYDRVPSDVLSNAALCRIGGATYHSKNFFPEKLLTTHTGSNLTFTWDPSAMCLVLNGTLTPQVGRVHLAAFRETIDEYLYSSALFYHSGTAEGIVGEGTGFVFITEDEEEIRLPIQQGDRFDLNVPYENVFGRFASVAIETDTAVTFRDFRFNLLLRGGYAKTLPFVPFEATVPQSGFPESLHILGTNEWHGNDVEFSGSLEIPVSFSTPCYNVSIGCHCETDNPQLRFVFVEALTEDGAEKSSRIPLGKASSQVLSAPKPIIGIRFKTSNGGDMYTVRLRNFHMGRIPCILSDPSPYNEPFEYTYVFPESFSRFQDLFFGIDKTICNYFDFERNVFVQCAEKFTVDGSLDWQADGGIEGRYRASFTAPENSVAKLFCPTAFFDAAESDDMPDESIYYTATEIFVQSTLFSSPESVKAFFTIQPLDIIYEAAGKVEFWEEDVNATIDPPLLPIVPGAHIYLTDSEEELYTAYLKIKYQTKLQ